MTSLRSIAAVAVGSLVAAVVAHAAPPYVSGPAQDRAQEACLKQEVKPNSTVWELCLSHVGRAYEWGEPALAKQLAKAAGDAKESCLDEGYDAESTGYRTCVSREMDARSQLMILGDDSSGDNVAQTQ
ncbi:hypothetical protein SAMN02745126_01995 [Enhydrobacter aerosaccus]|uniref:Uncharacterized protein n=1 Tax=Enhydrobacter aerosaccus TaxID=225324 RepID=A0A1T4MWQ8_9HYPH|nr:hypothetical protein [Enhydrobacter aerosaccus]SJZ71286.1 hypothetical protein SAMN02745126_01995 [Enhydrobacter aerosaccus]